MCLLGITKTSPEDHGTLLAFHALRLRFTICILVYCTVARMSSYSGQSERLSRRLVTFNPSPLIYLETPHLALRTLSTSFLKLNLPLVQ